ncbi:MAG: heparan-alpha-glucosaminide N-acetyltransferase domain-containing protein [Acutalibacteraceae bacterium]
MSFPARSWKPKFLFPFGFAYEGFASSDYFPLLPHLGWHMLGTVLGRTVYADKKHACPARSGKARSRGSSYWCGRQSLVHLPVPPAHCLRPSGTDRGIEKIKSMRPVQPCTGRAI